ncbi:nitrous oxide reductase accessory protein NosL [Methylobacter sp.]|uniref:nitrous oxide reductase accessory protein NosL n=1 Tax=Methylobacter sp. TaxID=2051955 RepID=UPI002FDCD283
MKLFIKPFPAYVGRAVRALAPKARTARPTADVLKPEIEERNFYRQLYTKIILWLFLLFSVNVSFADEPEVTIKKSDRCPVCGMFVYKYPKWVAQIMFKDGSYYFYDGAKDMFKHIFDTAKYTPGKSAENIKAIYVTDYYEVELIDAKSAFYVLGSDVLGPMGHELLPFKDRESAQEFLEDHKGKSIIRYQDVTPAVIESLDHRS